MKRLKIGRIAVAAAVVIPLLITLGCNWGPNNSSSNNLTIKYERPAIPCPTCPDEPWPYVVVYQHDLTTGSFKKTGENIFVGTLQVPLEVVVVLSVNDRQMSDGQNDCSWTEVGQGLEVNGYPVHISTHDCGAPWAGVVKIIVHQDGSVTQPY